MNQLPKISVIIPVYNAAPYLRACLDSVCKQGYFNLEVICVNDGSTDDSLLLLEEYACRDRRVTVLSQSNSGQAVARNKALEIATGDWILGLDSDDTLAPGALSKLSRHMVQDDVDIIWYGIRLVSDIVMDDRYFRTVYRGKQKVTLSLLMNTSVHFGGKVWRRSFVEKLGLRFPEGRLYEDAYFFYAAAPYARIIYFENEPLYNYLIRTDSTMGATRKRTPRGIDHLHIVEALLRLWRLRPLPSEFAGVSGEPGRFELFLFTTYYDATLGSTPKSMRSDVRDMIMRIGDEFGFFRSYPRQTAYIRYNTFLYRLFFRAKPDRIQYRIFGIPFFQKKWKFEKV